MGWKTNAIRFLVSAFGNIHSYNQREIDPLAWKLMQFTGLLDKNGKEVYEGDVVKCSEGCRHEVVFMDEVPTSNIGGMPGFYLNGLVDGYAWTGMEEIVGNVFENPELLDNKNK